MSISMTDLTHCPVSKLKKGNIIVDLNSYELENATPKYYIITRINKDTISTRSCSRSGVLNIQDAQIHKRKIPRPMPEWEIDALKAEHPERDYSYLYEERTIMILA